MSNIISILGDPGFDLNQCGAKAGNLDRLIRLGFRVPRGFVIEHHQDLEAISDKTLEFAVQQSGGWPVAVRSSGILEDLESASFAGQYESYLNVQTMDELRVRILECRKSAQSENVQAYLKQKDLSSEKALVSVLIQKMVAAETAGVGFSIHPITGKEENALIELCRGLGDRLVSGRTVPSSYVVDLFSGQVVEKKFGEDQAELSREQVGLLARTLLKIQAVFGAPQDVEWAFDKSGILWILQARPITRVQWRTDVDEFTNADLKDGGVSARVCTPLMFSFYRDATHQSMPQYFEKIRLRNKRSPSETWMTYFYGRVYWNVSATKRILFRIPGFDELKFDQDIGIQKDYGTEGPRRIPNRLGTLLSAIPIALALPREYSRQLRANQTFGEEFEKKEKYWKTRIQEWEGVRDSDFFQDLKEVFEGLHLWTETAYFSTVYNNSNAQTEFKGLIEEMDRSVGGVTSLVHLLGGLSDISHMELQTGLAHLYLIARENGFDQPQWKLELAKFLERHGFHSDAELDITVPRWSEAPYRIQEMIEGMIHSGVTPADPIQTTESQRIQFEQEVQRVERRLAGKTLNRLKYRQKFFKHLNRVRTFLVHRERMREFSTRCYGLIRLAVLASGKRLAQAQKIKAEDEIFMFHADEICSFAAGLISTAEMEARIQYRKQMYQGYRNFVPPNELGSGVLQRTAESYVDSNDSKILKGMGCSFGVKNGIVRVIHSIGELHQIQKGDILVTRFTDPSWTPVLGLVSGIVTEVGGLLSHAAVIGREYGIPAILNLPGATQVLKSGQSVRINGQTGTVEILS